MTSGTSGAEGRADCPMCASPLVAESVEGASVLCCRNKHGLLIDQRAFSAVLDRSWTAVPREYAESATLTRSQSHLDGRHCPTCANPMQRVPYCGMEAVIIDRCDGCEHLWLDAGALQAVLLAVAKMNYAQEHLAEALRTSWVPIPQQEALLPADSTEARIMAAFTYAPIGQLFGLLF